MKKYTVRWLPSAEQQLAKLWLDAVDRSAIRQAADELDEAMSNDP